jgi:hypothetical protein
LCEKDLRGCSVIKRLAKPGANPTIVSYNASAVKVYNAMSSLHT